VGFCTILVAVRPSFPIPFSPDPRKFVRTMSGRKGTREQRSRESDSRLLHVSHCRLFPLFLVAQRSRVTKGQRNKGTVQQRNSEAFESLKPFAVYQCSGVAMDQVIQGFSGFNVPAFHAAPPPRRQWITAEHYRAWLRCGRALLKKSRLR
jgi:hypothetical protein